ncbi:MAG: FkbM family methyltransferase [Clostridia bacterium]|nr:FkbM family methyltransferase [Clostridia bacterium]
MPSVLRDLFDLPDLAQRIARDSAAGRPLLLYGTGDGADKTAAWLGSLGVSPDGVFVSPEHAKGQTFRYFPVLSVDEALQRWNDPLVLLCFASSRPDVIDGIEALARRVELLIPDLPVAGETLFDLAFAKTHRNEIEAAYELFSDERSREVYSSLLSYKLSGELSPLLASAERDYDPFALLPTDRFKLALDGGAYDGDTARALLDRAPGLREIVCVEPDERNYRRLCVYRDREDRAAITPLRVALSDAPGAASLFASGNRNSTLFRCSHEARRETVDCRTVDELLDGRAVDFIKLDVEGSEAAALRGAEKTLSRCRPSLLVSAYHRSEDLFALPLILARLCPCCLFYLRRRRSLPAWDVDLICVPENQTKGNP